MSLYSWRINIVISIGWFFFAVLEFLGKSNDDLAFAYIFAAAGYLGWGLEERKNRIE